jgi:hypothetical protein
MCMAASHKVKEEDVAKVWTAGVGTSMQVHLEGNTIAAPPERDAPNAMRSWPRPEERC